MARGAAFQVHRFRAVYRIGDGCLALLPSGAVLDEGFHEGVDTVELRVIWR